MGNFTNVPRSLATKHQFFFFSNLKTFKLANNRVEVLKTTEFTRATLSLDCSNWLTNFGLEDEILELAVSFKISGQEYSVGNMLPIGADETNGYLIFGSLIGAVTSGYCFDRDSVVLLFARFDTIGFDSHRHCFLVKRSVAQLALSSTDLLDAHPLDLYASDTKGIFWLPLRYGVF